MARDRELVTCPPGVWTQLTNGDVTRITFQVQKASVEIRPTTGTAPTANSAEPGLVYAAPTGELNKLISDMTNLASADRVFAKPTSDDEAVVYVDHA